MAWCKLGIRKGVIIVNVMQISTCNVGLPHPRGWQGPLISPHLKAISRKTISCIVL